MPNSLVSAKSIKRNAGTLLNEILHVPDEARQRIPDSDHLGKIRAHIVQAHQNSAFVKELSDKDGYVPTAV